MTTTTTRWKTTDEGRLQDEKEASCLYGETGQPKGVDLIVLVAETRSTVEWEYRVGAILKGVRVRGLSKRVFDLARLVSVG